MKKMADIIKSLEEEGNDSLYANRKLYIGNTKTLENIEKIRYIGNDGSMDCYAIGFYEAVSADRFVQKDYKPEMMVCMARHTGTNDPLSIIILDPGDKKSKRISAENFISLSPVDDIKFINAYISLLFSKAKTFTDLNDKIEGAEE